MKPTGTIRGYNFNDFIENIAIESILETAQGKEFFVEIYEDFVVKYPKNIKEEDMLLVENNQNFLANKIKEVLPIKSIRLNGGLVLIEPRALGILCSNIPAYQWPIVREKRDLIIKRINDLGMILSDSHRKNIFYDEVSGDITLIDFTKLKHIN